MIEEIEFSSEIDVKLVRAMASDDMVVQAAQVSVKGENKPETVSERLISYLVDNRHGCYDDDTEVLTAGGWVRFPDVIGDELFVTLNASTQEIEYQRALRVIHEEPPECMIAIQTQKVDLLVTPNHRMYGEARTRHGWGSHVKTFPAYEMFERSHRLFTGGGFRHGVTVDPVDAELLGMIIADGSVNRNNISFHLKKERKIQWLENRTSVYSGRRDNYTIRVHPYILKLAKETYTKDRDRCIPKEVLETWSSDSIAHLINGFVEGDGHRGDHNKISLYTTSRQLVDDLQEAALLAGGSITETSPDLKRQEAFGTRPLYKLSLVGFRNSRPRVGWTTSAREQEVQLVRNYNGKTHCVTVDNGIICVRRKGKVLWCGNSPLEHNCFTFFVAAPIFVFREWHRHRIASINEMSGRYTVLKPRFYSPAPDRKMINVGTSARPEMAPGSKEQYDLMVKGDKTVCQLAWDTYQERLEAGISNELSRTILPLSVYSEMYWTVNARGLMNFLSLRVDSPDSHKRSRPQWEIQMGADKCEAIFAELMPITHAAFVKNGRVAP